MCNLVRFEVNEDVAVQLYVVENKVDVEITGISMDVLLPINESKSPAKFHYELLQVVDESLFKFAFVKTAVLAKSKELRNYGIFDIVKWVFLDYFG